MSLASRVIAVIGLLVAAGGLLGANFTAGVEFGLLGIALLLSALTIGMDQLIKATKAETRALQERNAQREPWQS